MILRLAWTSLLVVLAAAVGISAVIGGVWLWGVYTAPSTDEARALRERLALGPAPASEIFPSDWQALCVAGTGVHPVELLARQTYLAQTPCEGWRENFLTAGNLNSLLLADGRSCRAIPIRIDVINMRELSGLCVSRTQDPVLGLEERGTPPRPFLTIE